MPGVSRRGQGAPSPLKNAARESGCGCGGRPEGAALPRRPHCHVVAAMSTCDGGIIDVIGVPWLCRRQSVFHQIPRLCVGRHCRAIPNARLKRSSGFAQFPQSCGMARTFRAKQQHWTGCSVAAVAAVLVGCPRGRPARIRLRRILNRHVGLPRRHRVGLGLHREFCLPIGTPLLLSTRNLDRALTNKAARTIPNMIQLSDALAALDVHMYRAIYPRTRPPPP